MEKDPNDSVIHNSSPLKESETDKSLVDKFKSIINSTPLSKWFRRESENRVTIRRRDEVFGAEDICEMQPPSKRVKFPTESEENNCNNILFNEARTSTANSIPSEKFNYFQEPVAGPSGINTRKMLNSATGVSGSNTRRSTFNRSELFNGHKDSDSEESTSGYSSMARIGSKEQVCESQQSSKQTSPLQSSPNNTRSLFHKTHTSTNRSLFAEKSSSPHKNTSLSSRRPSFNASTFGSPNFVDKTLSTERIINSPFYNGKTIYGGASAYGRSLGRSSQDLKTSLRSSVQIKPVNKTTDSGNLVLGKTAKRILEALELYSSPVNDAKKIPIISKTTRKDGLLTRYVGANPYMVRESKVSSNTELQVPSVSDLLKMKQKMRLQDSTEAVRQIATSSKSSLNMEYYKISTSENEKEKHTSKIKTKITSVRSKQAENEIANEINLKPVSLPITTLPKFDLVIPPPASINKTPGRSEEIKKIQPSPTPKSQIAQPFHKTVETENNVQRDNEANAAVEFKFSDPLIIAENIQSLVAINDFKFSEPLLKKSKLESGTMPINFKMPENKFTSLPLPKNKTVSSPTPPLKTGSVMDILGKNNDVSLMDKFKPAQGTWECSACMIRNQPDKIKCIACETPKIAPAKQADSKSEFGSQFKLSADKWECSSCMVRNNNSSDKCIACGTAKPAAEPSATNNLNTNTPLSEFSSKFLPSSNTWECSVCLIRNKNEMNKCAACETAKPALAPTSTPSSSTFDNKFQPPAGSWECSSCLVRNKEDCNKCIACEQPKSSKSSGTGFGNSFKVKVDEWECSVCMVRNKLSNNKCQCCDAVKPGSIAKDAVNESDQGKKSISTFNFGIDKSSASSFNFGIPTTLSTSSLGTNSNVSAIFGEKAKPVEAPVTFSFGIPETSDKSKPTEPIKTVENTQTSSLQMVNPLLKPNVSLPEKARPSNEFKFGISSPATQLPNNKQTEKTSLQKSSITSCSEITKPTFNFNPVTANGDINKTTLLFGNKKTEASSKPVSINSAVTTAGTNMFNFGTKPPATATTTKNIVSTNSSQITTSKPLFNFGSKNHISSETAPSFNAVTTTSVTSGFSTTAPTFGTTNTSSFETVKKPSSGINKFTFGTSSNTTNEPINKEPVFTFIQSSGAPTANAPAKTTGFNFGSTSTPTFNFTGGKTESNNFSSSTNNIFGLPTSTASKNGTFNFGSMAANNSNQKAGFSFGAAINNVTTPQTQSGFNFGAVVAPASTSGGFNFSAAPTFDVNAKPTFNFTDGNVTTFTAQASTDGGMAVPRKIKKVVRRTQR